MSKLGMFGSSMLADYTFTVGGWVGVGWVVAGWMESVKLKLISVQLSYS